MACCSLVSTPFAAMQSLSFCTILNLARNLDRFSHMFRTQQFRGISPITSVSISFCSKRQILVNTPDALPDTKRKNRTSLFKNARPIYQERVWRSIEDFTFSAIFCYAIYSYLSFHPEARKVKFRHCKNYSIAISFTNKKLKIYSGV